jgi:hypothetical protein
LNSVVAGSAFETTRSGGDLLAAFELDPETRSPRSVMRRTGAAVRMVAPARAAEPPSLLLIAPMPPSGIDRPALPAGLPDQAVQQRQHRVVRARPEVRAEHGVEGERPLSSGDSKISSSTS